MRLRLPLSVLRRLPQSPVSPSPAYAGETGPGPGPDFICIGQAKAGTRWLYDQFRACDGVWMPPIKEINFLVGRAFNIPNRQAMSLADALTGEPRDVEFLQRFSTYRGLPLDFDWYGRLFLPKNGNISGDVSPTYSVLTGDEVRTIAPHLPTTKIVLLLRDPVSLAWSMLCQFQRSNWLPSSLFDNWSFVRLLLARAQNRQKLYATRIWPAWEPSFRGRIAVWFLDDIAARPEIVRDGICEFLGAPTGPWALPPDENAKSRLRKMPLSDAMRANLAAYFRDEIRGCAQMFGGAAQSWASRYNF